MRGRRRRIHAERERVVVKVTNHLGWRGVIVDFVGDLAAFVERITRFRSYFREECACGRLSFVLFGLLLLSLDHDV
jgi:hypothetical protein